MSINEIVERLNGYNKDCGTFDDLYGKYCDENDEFLHKYKYIYKGCIDTDEHRWYCIDTNVYEVFDKTLPAYQQESLGFVACTEVGTLKSESMSVEDCYHDIKFYVAEETVVTSYKIKES